MEKALKIMPAPSKREGFPNREEYLESIELLLQRKKNRVLFQDCPANLK